MSSLSYRNFNKLKFRQPFTLRAKELDQIGNGPIRPSPFEKRAARREIAHEPEGQVPIWKVFILSFVLLFALGVVLAQEELVPPAATEEAAIEAVNLDEDIQPEDLEISEPRILPDSPFYFMKNWARGIQDFFTFNPVRKAELRMKFANEKLIEAKKLVELKRDSENIKRATENYQQEIEKIKNQTEKIREKAKENPQVESFLDKFIHQQTLHQKLLQRLENQVPTEAFERIKEARERHLERFKDVMLKLEDRKEVTGEKLTEILEKQKGSQFKNFKNLEVLRNLEEKVPEEAREAIRKAQENALKRLQENLEKMSPEDQEKFKEYIERISGDKERHLEILESLKQEIQAVPLPPPAVLKLKEKLEEGKAKIIEKIGEKVDKIGCPIWTPPAPDFCQYGRVIIERDRETGCPLEPKCIIPGEIGIPPIPPIPPDILPRPGVPGVSPPEVPGAGACITLWYPVCGKDGKTYSNECFAKLAGVEVDYKGQCKERECLTDADCPQLRCGPAGIRCVGVKSKCVEGKCRVVPIPGLETCKDLCGDGICQEVVCLAIGCPCSETKETCPEDCK